jgi:hypothetical protein
MFGPEKLADVETFKRLATEEHDLEESQQGVDPTGKDVGNCKAQTTVTLVQAEVGTCEAGIHGRGRSTAWHLGASEPALPRCDSLRLTFQADSAIRIRDIEAA